MATVVAPVYGSNTANQKEAQLIVSTTVLPPTVLGYTVQAAPKPTAVNNSIVGATNVGHPIS